MTNIFPIDFEEKNTIANDDFILFSDSEDGNKLKKAQYSNLKGEQGDPGTPGADGTAATITVGTVTTGAPGSSATVTNSGTSSAAVLNFSIPQGATGTPGADGSDGADGAAATITVGTTTTLTPGSSATVTNVGTSSAAVLNFGIPQGTPGTGSGDVSGPASATDGHIAVFDGVTGKIIKDGGAIPTAPVSSVNTQTGAVVLDADDISDSTTTNKFVTSSDKTTWSGKQDALTLPATPTQGNLVTRGANNKSLVDGGTIPTGVPSGGTDGQVLSKVSGSVAWANPTGGISNITTGTTTTVTGIWAGTDAEYNLLTPDANTLYFTF